METGGKMTSKNVHEIHKTLPMMSIARTYNSVEVIKKVDKDKKNGSKKTVSGSKKSSVNKSNLSRSKSNSRSQGKSDVDMKSESRLKEE